MTHIFEATSVNVGDVVRSDFDSMEAAVRFCEGLKNGRVVHFVKDFDGRCRSASMQVLGYDMVWRGINIHQ